MQAHYEGKVGDIAAVGRYEGSTLVALHKMEVVDEIRAGVGHRVALLPSGQARRLWFLRLDGVRVSSRGEPLQDPEHRLLGAWNDAWGDADIEGPTAAAAALRKAVAAKVQDPRQRSVARCVGDLCALFGVDPDTLATRLAADPNDPTEMAHNGLRKFAVGAIVHLSYEVDIAWTGERGNVAPQSLRRITEVPQLAGVHRMTLARFREQFAALCGFSTEDGTIVGEPPSEVGRFVRDRYIKIRKTAVLEAAAGA